MASHADTSEWYVTLTSPHRYTERTVLQVHSSVLSVCNLPLIHFAGTTDMSLRSPSASFIFRGNGQRIDASTAPIRPINNQMTPGRVRHSGTKMREVLAALKVPGDARTLVSLAGA
jgi:hypothetical protein